jgi:hypothetical protein
MAWQPLAGHLLVREFDPWVTVLPRLGGSVRRNRLVYTDVVIYSGARAIWGLMSAAISGRKVCTARFFLWYHAIFSLDDTTGRAAIPGGPPGESYAIMVAPPLQAESLNRRKGFRTLSRGCTPTFWSFFCQSLSLVGAYQQGDFEARWGEVELAPFH